MAESPATCLRCRGISSSSTSSRASSSSEVKAASYSARPRRSTSRSAPTNFLPFQHGRRAVAVESGGDRALPGVRRDHRRAAPGLNGPLKNRDRSLVLGGELQEMVAVDDGLLLQRAEGLLISGHRGELDTQEGVEPFYHVVDKSTQHASFASRFCCSSPLSCALLRSKSARLPMQSVRRAESSVAGAHRRQVGIARRGTDRGQRAAAANAPVAA